MKELKLPLRTHRLVLRRFEAGDLAGYHAYHSLPETARFLPGEAKSYTQSMELLGELVLKWLPGRGQAEIGWSLAPAAQGKGIGTEAAAALLRHSFQELGFHRIVARLDALNTASAALCERLGMRLVSTQADKWHYKGRWATETVYALLAQEWAARQEPPPVA